MLFNLFVRYRVIGIACCIGREMFDITQIMVDTTTSSCRFRIGVVD